MFLTNALLIDGKKKTFFKLFITQQFCTKHLWEPFTVWLLPSARLQIWAAEIRPCVCCVKFLNSFPKVS